ncbi:MAG: hypothetical protein ACYDCQ_01290 [Dehalococcoidia bacterium]
MTNEAIPVDISTNPELARIAHETVRTGRRHSLVENGTVIAVVAPARRRRKAARATTQEEFEAALKATFGAWQGLIDPEEFKRQRREL